jgi:hypothetical protein
MKKSNIQKSNNNESENSTKFIQSLRSERDTLKKQNAIFHNAFMEINMSLCRDLTSEQRLQEILNKVQSTRISVAQVMPSSTIVLV